MSSSTESVAVQTHLNGIIEELMSNGGQMQEKYILPPHQRPHLSEVRVCSESIPVVDLKDLDGPNRKRVLQEIRRACEEDGFFQAVSNGRFKSAEHRAVTNGSTARLSIPSFYGPSYDAFLSPAASMVDEEHPPLYRGYQVGEFMGMFWNKGVSSKALLDSFKIKYPQDNGE